MKTMKKIMACFMTFVLVATLVVSLMPDTAVAATKPKLSKKKVTLTITDKKKSPSVTLKMKGVSKKVAKKAKWSTSNKSVATVKKGKVTAKRAGKATITCKVKSKKYTCKVTVKDKRKAGTEKADSKALNITVKKASENGGKNEIKVTYNGKDVTDKATYKTRYRDYPNNPSKYVEKPGIAPEKAHITFWLTVSYNGETKTVEFVKRAVSDIYIECFCGEKFYTDEGYTCIGMKGCLCATADYRMTEFKEFKCASGKYFKHSYQKTAVEHEPGHDQYWDVPYARYIDYVME